MNRSGHPSVPLQQNTLWGHAPLLCAHHEEPTEPLHKGQLKSGWWWKARHHKRKQIRPMNNHHSTVQRSLGLKAALLSFKMWRCATHPQQNQPLRPSLQPHPLLYSSPPESSVGVLNFKHHLMKKSGGVRHEFPLLSDPAASPTPKARIDFVWTGSTRVGDHQPRPPPVAAMHHDQLGKDSRTLTGLRLINPASLSATAERFARCDFLFRTSEGCYTIMLNFFSLIPHGWFLRMS